MIRVLSFAAALSLAACAQAEPQGTEAPAAAEAASPAEAKAWMANNAKQPGVVTLPGGVQYKVLQSGPKTGPTPKPQDDIKVHYEGTLTDGTVFDSSYQQGSPLVARLDRLVPGWIEALQLMRPGDTWMIYLPPEKGYGGEGAGPIPPYSVLVFKIEMLGVLPRGAG
jgi:peptidylprolyl isomerase/FKBP-type peptidyl-prolyl cis-trans isomerase FklB